MLLNNMRLSFVPVWHHCTVDMVFHCCVQRTASQWVKRILSDLLTYQYSGLKLYDARVLGVVKNSYTGGPLEKTFPRRRVVSPLYINFKQFSLIPKHGDFKVFFVIRDPRDIVVSHYFASKYSHTPIGDIPTRRQLLTRLSIEDGLIYTINYLNEYGLFDAIHSWHQAASAYRAHVLIVRYEDLVGPNQLKAFRRVFAHCDIRMPDREIQKLLTKYSFQRVSGHRRGEIDKWSHYRKGQPRDWVNYFTPKVRKVFESTAGELVTLLGYSE